MNKKKLFSFLIFIPLLLTGCLRGTNETSSESSFIEEKSSKPDKQSKDEETSESPVSMISYVTVENRYPEFCEVVDVIENVPLYEECSFRIKVFGGYNIKNVVIRDQENRRIDYWQYIDDTYSFYADKEILNLYFEANFEIEERYANIGISDYYHLMAEDCYVMTSDGQVHIDNYKNHDSGWYQFPLNTEIIFSFKFI